MSRGALASHMNLRRFERSGLVLITISPNPLSIAAETSGSLTAMGRYTDGSTKDITADATWASGDESVVTVSNASMQEGQVTGVSAGTAVITARLAGITGSVNVTVTAATLVSIAITPDPVTVAKGRTQQFIATGTFSDSSTQDLTTSCTWSSDSAHVTISDSPGSKGLATAATVGAATITATLGLVSDTASMTTDVAALDSILVTPDGASTAAGLTRQMTATGTYSDLTTADITTSCTWDTSDHAKATVGASTGLVQTLVAGSVTITATLGSVSDDASLTVDAAALVSIAVTPSDPSVSMIDTQQFTATGTYTDSSTQDLTTSVTWSSDTPAAATINASTGLATAVLVGSTTITATLGALSNSTTLTLTGLAAFQADPRGVWESDLDVAVVSGAVSQWDTQAGTINLANSNAGTRPTYINDGTGPNGRPCLRHGTSGKYLYALSDSSLQPTALTVFCVTKANSLGATFRVLMQLTNTTGSWGDGYGFSDDSVAGTIDGWIKAYTSHVRATVSTGAWHVLEMVYGSGTLELLIDGTSIGTLSTAAPTYSGTDYLVLGAGISGAGPTYGYYWDGDTAALSIDGTAMSSGARSAARAYLGTKYGITVV